MGSGSFLHEAVDVTQSLPGGCFGQQKGSAALCEDDWTGFGTSGDRGVCDMQAKF